LRRFGKLINEDYSVGWHSSTHSQFSLEKGREMNGEEM
jgi:hypothetical protein